MVGGPSNYPKPLHLLQLFSLKLSPSSSSSSSSSSSIMKLKTLIHTLVFCHVRRFLRALSAAKSKTISIVVHTIKETQPMQLIIYPLTKNKKKKNKKTTKSIFFGSFRLHYNFCSSKYSHVLPVPAPVFDRLSSAASAPAPGSGTQFYYDSTWNSVIPTGQCCYEENNGPDPIDSQLSGYLQWLEEKKVHGKSSGSAAGDHDNHDDFDAGDIDKLADMFIANCHAKFILEKQESARRFKEMLERSA